MVSVCSRSCVGKKQERFFIINNVMVLIFYHHENLKENNNNPTIIYGTLGFGEIEIVKLHSCRIEMDKFEN